jgi:hypothetical protein
LPACVPKKAERGLAVPDITARNACLVDLLTSKWNLEPVNKHLLAWFLPKSESDRISVGKGDKQIPLGLVFANQGHGGSPLDNQ